MSELASEIVLALGSFGYVESSFSGFGIRILFKQLCIKDYKQDYYLKNSNLGLEYYQFDQPGRYVSVTGNCFIDNPLDCKEDHSADIKAFLEKYMKRPFRVMASHASQSVSDSRSLEELMKKVRYMYLTDSVFQDLWFDPAPGHGSNESERDYHLVAELYDNVTQDPDKILELFEQSDFFKTKDHAHLYKFTRDSHKYFHYIYNVIHSKH